MLIRIALRNIWLHRLRTAIVGGLIVLGTVLVIVGGAILDAVNQGMRTSVVKSIAGDLQVYDADAEDELALFGQPGGVEADIGQISDFGATRDALMKLDNVQSVVPMGTHTAIIMGGNALDRKLAELREAVREGKPSEEIAPLVAHTRRMVEMLRDDMKNLGEIMTDKSVTKEDLAAVDRASSDELWKGFDDKPYDVLEFLENRIAPLGTAADMQFIRFIGTDPQQFAEEFELFEIVDGEMIPPGQRGLLYNKRRYEHDVKNRIANKLDEIKEARDDEQRRIATDEELKTWVDRNVRQYRTLTFELDGKEAEHVRSVLQKHLGSTETDVDELLQQFLAMNDDNFEERYKLFYDHIAPRIQLYKYPIGENITLTSFTKSGYPKSVNLKLWGTFTFESLEKSQLAGSQSLMDLISFRELYGLPTPEQKKEMKELAKEVGTKDVAADEAVDALFGEDSEVVVEGGDTGFDEFAGADLAGRREEAMKAQEKPYTKAQLERGMALSAAVFLKDPSKSDKTIQAIEALGGDGGPKLQAATWDEASGLVGQFTGAISLTLMVMVGIIFVVALVIINNSMVMATMDRTREIGTIRAIGGQRRTVLSMFLIETLVLSLIFGLIGAAIGSGIVLWLQATGIPAFHNILYFLFAGPSLHPALLPTHLITAFGIIFVVSVLSTFYPALLAARIPPVVAMQGKD